MTGYAHGHHAEKVAARWLQHQGYKVYALNWRSPRAEIDIIAQQPGGPLQFIEVKYRQSTGQGTGLEYITPTKQRQMRFAAELWVAQHRYEGEYVLSGLEVSGVDYRVSAFIESIS
ncbi:MAG TPA: YraN family protein [Candidatus Saccharimonadales bacterium]|nr:YraN family protein [Candidatus Saccharimonadales bacterium]